MYHWFLAQSIFFIVCAHVSSSNCDESRMCLSRYNVFRRECTIWIQGRDAKLRSRFVHAVATIAGVYPAVLTRQLLLTSLGAMPFADATCRGRFSGTLADKLPL